MVDAVVDAVVERPWRVARVDLAERDRLARALSLSPITAALLIQRGIRSSDEAQRFFQPRLHDLHDPFLLPDMDRAAERIEQAVRSRERIAVCGDYDADGLSATALLVEFFRLLEHPVLTSIPLRLEEGYGLNADQVTRLHAQGVRLIITVDNGSCAAREIALARELGMEVVVTDHHQPPDGPTGAVALVNPWLPTSSYPFPHLAGVGVVFKLVWAVSQKFSRSRKVSPPFRDFMMQSLALAALGTISDVVPLFGENRVLARYGLETLGSSRSPGLRRLATHALRGEDRRLCAEDVAFRMAPALNAAGRLGSAETALRLLTTGSESEAEELMTALQRENRRRQTVEAAIHAAARARVLEEVDLRRSRAIVLAGEGWHPGVVGIVASRLVEEFFRPTVLIALQEGRGRGSARSIPGVHLCQALDRCRQHLIAFGGHARAAGVEVAADKVENLRRAFEEAIPLPPEEMVCGLDIEAEVGLGDLGPALLGELSRLEPYGQGNGPPLFAARGLALAGAPRALGQDGRHLSFFVRSEGPASSPAMRAVAFGMNALPPALLARGARLDLAFRPQVNSWGGGGSIELMVKEIRPTLDGGGGRSSPTSAATRGLPLLGA